MAEARAYLDHNATTALRPSAAAAMTLAFGMIGNPSSIHAEGRAARAAMDRARGQVASAVGGSGKDVIFTSGATEALNTLLRPSPAISSASGARRTERLLVLATEHSAVLAGGGFAPDLVETIPVDAQGIINLAQLEQRLAELATADSVAPVTVAVQLANSETGVIQSVSAVSELVHRFGALLVCDCVAALGKIPVTLPDLGADAIVVSAHKFGGPKGAGAIILNGSRLHLDQPLLSGGGQEMRRRSGTENVAAIVGMGVAAEDAVSGIEVEAGRVAALRQRLLAGFRQLRPDLVVFGEKAPRLPNTLNIGVPGLRSETAVIAFDLDGIAVSSGSACSSGKVKRSHVLDAMGVSGELADGALRFSLGWNTTQADIERAIAVFGKVAKAGRREEIAA